MKHLRIEIWKRGGPAWMKDSLMKHLRIEIWDHSIEHETHSLLEVGEVDFPVKDDVRSIWGDIMSDHIILGHEIRIKLIGDDHEKR